MDGPRRTVEEQNNRYFQPKEIEKITINEKKETKKPGYVNYRTIVADNEAEIERLKAEK